MLELVPPSRTELHPFESGYYITPSGLLTPKGVEIPAGLDTRVEHDALELLEAIRDEQITPPQNEDDVFALLAREPRAAKYIDGRHESVLEHSYHLQGLMLEVAETRPDISEYEARMIPLVHDWDEALGKDTVIMDPLSEATRFLRGAANATILYKHIPMSNPHMRMYDLYRRCENRGIWTPAAGANKGMDKVAAYDFQLQPNVHATLHRERQESFEEITHIGMPKVAHDLSALRYMAVTLVDLGLNMESWGCKKPEGDPVMLVEFYAHHALARYLAKNQDTKLTSEQQADVHAIAQIAGSERVLAQPILKPDELHRYGGNVVLLNQRQNGPTPPPDRPSGLKLAV